MSTIVEKSMAESLKKVNNIMKNLECDMREVLSDHISAIKFNLNNVLRGILYDVIFSINNAKSKVPIEIELEKMINHVIDTSHYTGPEQERYPTFDSRTSVDKITNYIKKSIREHYKEKQK